MLPIIALIGKPNVGKSSLFNILTDSNKAITSQKSGTTRDRNYGHYIIKEEKKFKIIDTAGITNTKSIIKKKSIKNTKKAIKEAHIIFFIVDGKEGITKEDHFISKIIKKKKKKTYLIINKTENIKKNKKICEFYKLGYKKIHKISTMLPKTIKNVISKIKFKEKNINKIKKKRTNITIIGKPNVGKSTLGNALLKKKQFITDKKPGTTRDSISILNKIKKKKYILTDTAGICKKKNIKNEIELCSIKQSIKMIKKSKIIILILDISEKKISKQDLSIIKIIIKNGNFLLITVNKEDKISIKEKKEIKEGIKKKLKFLNIKKIHFLSALYETGIKKLMLSIQKILNIKKKKFSCQFLTKILKKAIKKHQPPIQKKIRIKPKYAHTGKINPYTIIIHGNKVNNLPKSYINYLKNFFQKEMKLNNCIIKLIFKENKNPFIKK
ncbi:ribosome biogenesis GTPase Der [Buchnera aphidicola (Mollitrichosiphum nigrofasciatum)]|uniref:ribosome biogenesis GTPase Der n=1 Tax=Buchnera aphidicola TaxID=9 RepID=UPI0031B81774